MTDDGTKYFVERKNKMHCYNTLQHSQSEGLFTFFYLLLGYMIIEVIFTRNIFLQQNYTLFSVLKLITLQTLYDKFSLIIKKTNFEYRLKGNPPKS